MLFDRLKETRSLAKSLADPHWLGDMPGSSVIFSNIEKKLDEVDRANHKYDELVEEFQPGFRTPEKLLKSELEMAKQQLAELHAIVAGCTEVKKMFGQLNDLAAPGLWQENLTAGGMQPEEAQRFVESTRSEYEGTRKTITLDEFLHAAAAQGVIGEKEYLSKARESKAGRAVRESLEGRLPRELLANPATVKKEDNALLHSTVMSIGLQHANVLIEDLSQMAKRNIRYLTEKWPSQLGKYRDRVPQRS